ncbi:MAG TPA: MFS transporter [Spirochaetes bacterium]|nr:MFS transporter [Spirochaetota bacterium]
MEPRKRTVFEMFTFALGLYAVQAFWGLNASTLPLYFLEMTGSKSLTGLILSSAGVFGAVVPVLAGGISDRVSTPWGRRKPFIVAGWLCAAVSLLALSRISTPAAAVPVSLFLYAAFFTAIGPYFALMPDITPKEQRGAAAGMMFLVGGMGILSYLYLGARTWDTSKTLPFIWGIALTVIPAGLMVAGTREPRRAAGSPITGRLFREALQNRPATAYLLALVLAWTGLWMVSAFFVAAFREMFNLTTDRAVMGFLIFTLVFIAGALPAGLIGERFGRKRVTAAGFLLLAGCLLLTGLIDGLMAAQILIGMSGIGYAVLLAVGYSYYLTLVPPERTAGYVGLYMACQNGTILTGPAIAGVIIETWGYRWMFPCAGAFVLAGFLTFLVLSRGPRAGRAG